MESKKPTVWIVRDKRSGKVRLRSRDANGKLKQQTTQHTRRKDAARDAAAKEQELAKAGRLKTHGWESFCDCYASEKLPSLAKKTKKHWNTVANKIDAINVLSPGERHPMPAIEFIDDITASYLSTLAATFRKAGLSEASIMSYLGALQSALGWAVDPKGFIDKVPAFPELRRARTEAASRGRTMTGEEFERMLGYFDSPKPQLPKDAPQAERDRAWRKPKRELAAQWKRDIVGMDLSGVRLEEVTEIYWNREDKNHILDIEGKRPKLKIHQELEKGNKDRVYPLTPDFVAWLRETPTMRQVGRVFKFPGNSGAPISDPRKIGRIISDAGQFARVVIGIGPSTGKKKFASSKDLRKRFADRWAPEVQPIVLMRLMRHKDIKTTLKHYVTLEADKTAEVVWRIDAKRSAEKLASQREKKPAASRP